MTTVNSALGVRIATGDAAKNLLDLRNGLEGAAQGVARLGREIQNHSGNIQRVLNDLSKYSFSGLARSFSTEADKTYKAAKPFRQRMEAMFAATGTSAGAAMGAGLGEGLRNAATPAAAAARETVRRLEKEMDASRSTARRTGKAVVQGMVDDTARVSTHTKNLIKYYDQMSSKSRATASHMRSVMEANTTLVAQQAGAHQDLLGMYRKMSAALNTVEAAEQAFRSSTSARVTSAVRALTAENAELAKMRVHYGALQREGTRAFVKTFETKAARPAQVRSQVGALTVMPARDAGLAAHYGELQRISLAVEGVRRAEKAWLDATPARVTSAVRALTAENAELAKMRVHYSALQAAKGTEALPNAFRKAGGAADQSRGAIQRWADQTKIAHDAARGAAAGVGYLWMTWGNIGAMAAGFTAVRGMTAALKEMTAIEKELTFAAEAGGGTVEGLNARIMGMFGNGNRMAHTAGQLAEALKNLTLAGFSTDEAFQMLGHTYKFAAAGELDLAEAAQGVQQTMNSFRLPMSETGRVTDVLAKAAAASAVTIDDMIQAMKTGSVVGAQYNVTIEDFAKSAALLGKVGIIGQAAGTAIKNFYTEVSSPKSIKAQEAMSRFGLTFYKTGEDGIRTLKPLSGIIDELRDKFRGLSETNQEIFLKNLNDIFNERGIKEAAQLIKMSEAEYAKLNETLGESAGFVDRLYGALSKTTQGIFTDLKAQGFAALVDALKAADPAVKALGESLRTLVTSAGFKEFLTDAATLLANLTQLMVEHGRAVLGVLAAYKGFQLTRGLLIPLIAGVASLAATISNLARVMKIAAAGKLALLAGARGLTGAVGALAAGKGALLLTLGGVARALPVIGGLLTAGTILWSLWGDSAERASIKARKTVENGIKSARDLHAELERNRKAGELGANGHDILRVTEKIRELRQAFKDLDKVYGKGNRSSDRVKQEQEILTAIKNLGADYGRLKADSEAAASAAATSAAPVTPTFPTDPDPGALKEEKALAKERLENQVNLAKTASQLLLDDLKHQYDMRLLTEVEYNDASYSAKNEALLREYTLYAEHYEKMKKLGKASEAKDALTKVDSAAAAIGKNNQESAQASDLIRKREQDAVYGQEKGFRESQRRTDFDRSMRGVSEWERPFYAEQERLINEQNAKIEDAERQGKAYSAEAQAAMWANMRAHLEGLWSRANEITPERLQAMVAEFNDRKAAKAQELDAQVALGTLSQSEARQTLNRFIVDSAAGLRALAGTNLDALIDGLGLSAVEADKLRAAIASALAEADKAGKTTWLDGVKAGLDEYAASATDTFANVKDMTTKAFKGMGDALTEFVMTGKGDFKSLANSIIRDMIRIQIQQNSTKVLGGLAKFAVSAIGGMLGGGGGGATVGSMMSSQYSGFTSSEIIAHAGGSFAKGGSFEGASGLSAYTNSVVSRPTLFPFAKGIGLMGEKPGSPGEAIMPLTRMSGGDLGVKVAGAGGAGAGSVVVSVTFNDNRTQENTKQEGDKSAGPKLASMIKGAVHEVLITEMRPGGLLA